MRYILFNNLTKIYPLCDFDNVLTLAKDPIERKVRYQTQKILIYLLIENEFYHM
jgi:hypothetical protein